MVHSGQFGGVWYLNFTTIHFQLDAFDLILAKFIEDCTRPTINTKLLRATCSSYSEVCICPHKVIDPVICFGIRNSEL